MPYLVCDKCGGYYKLEKGESLEDFEQTCQCGGKLEYYSRLPDYFLDSYMEGGFNHNFDEEVSESHKKEKKSKAIFGVWNNLNTGSKGFIAISVFGLVFLILILNSGILSSLSPSYLDIMPPEIQNVHAPILVVLFAPRCPACQKLNSETLNNQNVRAKLYSYSIVRINVDTNQEQARRFKVSTIPTLVLLDANGREIRRHVGYMNPEELIKFLS